MIRRFEDSTTGHWVEIDEVTKTYRSKTHPVARKLIVTAGDIIIFGYKEVAMNGYDPNDLFSSKPCCGGGIGFNGASYDGKTAKWHDSDCDVIRKLQQAAQEKLPESLDYRPKSSDNVCECGADSVYGPGNTLHSATMPCPLYRK